MNKNDKIRVKEAIHKIEWFWDVRYEGSTDHLKKQEVLTNLRELIY